MSGEKHTLGPWTITTEDLRGGRYWSVHRGNNDDEPIDLHEKENGEADARLIAAAPDMLAALHTAVNWFTPPNDNGPFPLKEIVDAIAKASGLDAKAREG